MNLTAPSATPTPSPLPTPTVPVAVAAGGAFHGGEVGVAYAPVALSATGGRAPYKWSVSAGALPGGLALGSDGSVSGIPTVAGTFTFTVQAADSGDSSATLPGTITVAAALSASLIPSCETYCYVELGCVSACGGFGQQSGGLGPYSYTLTHGPLPAGTALSGLSLTGTFTGASGWLQFTVQVSDVLGGTAAIAPKFWMLDHISMSGTYQCFGTYINSCTAQIPFSGGRGTPTVAVVGTSSYCPPNSIICPPAPAGPPRGFTAAASGSSIVVTVPANCNTACRAGYSGAVSIRLTDQMLCAAGTFCVSGVAVVDVYMLPG